ncbi:MAG: MoaD/ThiS family protein [Myxococcota bacterium]
MVQVRLFTLLSQATGLDSYESSAKDVEGLLSELLQRHGESVARYLEGCIVLVNGTNAGYLRGKKTKLKDGDEVSLFPPIAGG